MGKQRSTVLILGDGLTEFFYLQSLRDLFKRITIEPDYPKHTNMAELEQQIIQGINKGYDHIFCVIDMDTKEEESECTQYTKLKAKYTGVINKPKKGIRCQIAFFETHRCTELFFLYYFHYTSRPYQDQEALIRELNQYVRYEKKREFFKKCKGLHTYFEKNGGSLDTAVANAEHSICERSVSAREYTYSELGKLIKRLRDIEMCK